GSVQPFMVAPSRTVGGNVSLPGGRLSQTGLTQQWPLVPFRVPGTGEAATTNGGRRGRGDGLSGRAHPPIRVPRRPAAAQAPAAGSDPAGGAAAGSCFEP